MLKNRLAREQYLTHPLTFQPSGAVQTSGRVSHIREQILQTVLTSPGERVFRPSFGAGAKHLVFEPSTEQAGVLASRRLVAALTDVLAGEVDPKTLNVEVSAENESLVIRVSYQIAAVAQREEHAIAIGG